MCTGYHDAERPSRGGASGTAWGDNSSFALELYDGTKCQLSVDPTEDRLKA